MASLRALATLVRRASTSAALGSMSLSPRARAACSLHLQDELPEPHDPRAIIASFRETVNMSADEMERWLAQPQSRLAVEQVAEDADKEGRHAARRIVELLRKDDELFYEGDLLQMYQITEYIKCRKSTLAEAAEGALSPEELESSLERYHLLNYGFDCCKLLGGGGPEAAGSDAGPSGAAVPASAAGTASGGGGGAGMGDKQEQAVPMGSTAAQVSVKRQREEEEAMQRP